MRTRRWREGARGRGRRRWRARRRKAKAKPATVSFRAWDSKAGERRQPSGRSRVKDLAASPVQRRDDEKRASRQRARAMHVRTGTTRRPPSVRCRRPSLRPRLACARLPVARRPNPDGRRAAGGVRERVSRPSTCDLATRPERFAGIAVRSEGLRGRPEVYLMKCSKRTSRFAGLFFMRDVPEIVISSHREFTRVRIDPFSSNEGVAEKCVIAASELRRFSRPLRVC